MLSSTSPSPTAVAVLAEVTASPISGAVDAPATGGSGEPDVTDHGNVTPLTGGEALPATAEVPAAEVPAAGGAAAPGAAPQELPFTGLEVSVLVLVGLLLLAGGAGANLAGRRRPAHAVPGLWSR